MSVLLYKGYQASVEFEDGALFIKVLHIKDILIAQCDHASGVQSAFEALVDDYLKSCEELGDEPEKPFKGSFNVRIPPDIHRRAALNATKKGTSLNSWVQEAIVSKLTESERFVFDTLPSDITKLLSFMKERQKLFMSEPIVRRGIREIGIYNETRPVSHHLRKPLTISAYSRGGVN